MKGYMTLYASCELHHEVRIAAALRGCSIYSLVTKALRRELDGDGEAIHTPPAAIAPSEPPAPVFSAPEPLALPVPSMPVPTAPTAVSGGMWVAFFDRAEERRNNPDPDAPERVRKRRYIPRVKTPAPSHS